MALTTTLPSNQVPVFPVRLTYIPQITADVTDAAVKVQVPFPYRIHGVTGSIVSAGGSTVHTDIDVQVMVNATELVAALPVVDGSTIARAQGTLALSGANLDRAADDVLAIKLINITGGSSPTADGLWVDVWISRR
jgi:hypothetical protein